MSHWNYIYLTHCVALSAKNLVIVKKHVREEKSAPSVDRLDTTAVLAAMIRNVPPAQVLILPSVRNVQKGSL